MSQGSTIPIRYLLDLRAAPQDVPDMTLQVSPGNVYVGNTRVQFAGGNSPAFVAPGVTNRIDELSLNEAGTLEITEGVAGASPAPPAPVAGSLVICYVYIQSTATSIIAYNDANATHGYIWADARPFLWPPPQDLTTDAAVTFGRLGLGVAPDLDARMIAAGQYVSQLNDLGNSTDPMDVDWADGNVQAITLVADIATLTFSNEIEGGLYLLVLTQDGTGGWTVAWPANVVWPAATEPTLSGANKTDVIALVKKGTKFIAIASQDFAL